MGGGERPGPTWRDSLGGLTQARHTFPIPVNGDHPHSCPSKQSCVPSNFSPTLYQLYTRHPCGMHVSPTPATLLQAVITPCLDSCSGLRGLPLTLSLLNQEIFPGTLIKPLPCLVKTLQRPLTACKMTPTQLRVSRFLLVTHSSSLRCAPRKLFGVFPSA